MSEKFVTLNFTHQSPEIDFILSQVNKHLKFNTLETYTEEFEDKYLTDVYLTGPIDVIIESLVENYENKNINCSWDIVDPLD
jgi:hypothetical protein